MVDCRESQIAEIENYADCDALFFASLPRVFHKLRNGSTLLLQNAGSFLLASLISKVEIKSKTFLNRA